jgi:hypothetical protein
MENQWGTVNSADDKRYDRMGLRRRAGLNVLMTGGKGTFRTVRKCPPGIIRACEYGVSLHLIVQIRNSLGKWDAGMTACYPAGDQSGEYVSVVRNGHAPDGLAVEFIACGDP